MLRAVLSLAMVGAASAFSGQQVGGTHDEHGCNPSTGFTWCESAKKCQKEWMTPCKPSGTPSGGQVTGPPTMGLPNNNPAPAPSVGPTTTSTTSTKLLKNKMCATNHRLSKYRYASLKSAQAVCARSGSRCKGVYDVRCSGRGPFYVCGSNSTRLTYGGTGIEIPRTMRPVVMDGGMMRAPEQQQPMLNGRRRMQSVLTSSAHGCVYLPRHTQALIPMTRPQGPQIAMGRPFATARSAGLTAEASELFAEW